MNTIYAGGKPITRLGANMFHVLSFALRYPGWHSCINARKEHNALVRLETRGVMEIARHSSRDWQFRFNDTRGN